MHARFYFASFRQTKLSQTTLVEMAEDPNYFLNIDLSIFIQTQVT